MDIDLTTEQEDALCEPYFATPPPDDYLLGLLRTVFKLDKFRPRQLEAIRDVLSGKDCFVRMATGSGKSLLWQVPTFDCYQIYSKSTLVIKHSSLLWRSQTVVVTH
jgi:superfamily II DNA helicase RecQ